MIDIAHQAQEQMDTLPRANLSAVSSSSNLSALSTTSKSTQQSTKLALSPLAATQRTLTSPKQAFNTSKQALSNLGKQFAKINLNKLKVGGGNSRFVPPVWYQKVDAPKQASQLSLETALIGETSSSSEQLSTLPRKYSNADIMDVLKTEEPDDVVELLRDDDFIMDSCGVLKTDSEQILRVISSTSLKESQDKVDEKQQSDGEKLTAELLHRRKLHLGMTRVKSMDEYEASKRLSLPLKSDTKPAPKPQFFLADEKLIVPAESRSSRSVGDIRIDVENMGKDSDHLRPGVTRQISKSAENVSSSESQKQQILASAVITDSHGKSSESLIILTDTDAANTQDNAEKVSSSSGNLERSSSTSVGAHMSLSKSVSATPMPSQPDTDQTWVDTSAATLPINQPSMRLSFSEGALMSQMDDGDDSSNQGVANNPFSKLKVKHFLLIFFKLYI